MPAALPLVSEEPTPEELQALLEAWLKAKAAVLAGGRAELPLDELARAPQVDRLNRQRREDEAAGLSQAIDSSVRRFTITSRSANRIEAEVELRYSDELRNSQGKVLERTPEGSRSNRYVFGRDGKTWKLVFFRPLA
ncbi:IMS domain-containing protein [Cyanobium sp. ATX-6F1]|uniref:IMS domain-containing protein n=1 Tax=Cyanobium sp. ATX-6F1 TaxID=3137388 RepID=UPI0039BE9F41